MDSQANGTTRIAIASDDDGRVLPFESASSYTIVKMERGEVISTEARAGQLDDVAELYEALEDCSLIVASDIKEETLAHLVEHGISPVVTDLVSVEEVVTARLADRLKSVKSSSGEGL